MNPHSDQLDALASALAKAQAEMHQPKRTSQNPHLRNKFADLSEVIESTKKTLAAHGLSITQSVESRVTEGGQQVAGVRTVMLHSSGQWIGFYGEQVVDVAKGLNTSQAIGSAVTYLRRYGWSAACGVASDPDDDGNEAAHNASGGGSVPAKARLAAARSNGGRMPAKPRDSITDEQIAVIHDLGDTIYGSRERCSSAINEALEKRGLPDMSYISGDQAAKWIESWTDKASFVADATEAIK